MYLMISLIVITILTCIMAFVFCNIYENKNSCEIFYTLSIVFIMLAVVFFIASMACGGVCISENVNTDVKIAKYEAKRESLVYQIENETYLNDNNMGTYELFKDVSKFNQDILSGKILHENPWYSWFRGEYYKSIDPISFNK